MNRNLEIPKGLNMNNIRRSLVKERISLKSKTPKVFNLISIKTVLEKTDGSSSTPLRVGRFLSLFFGQQVTPAVIHV